MKWFNNVCVVLAVLVSSTFAFGQQDEDVPKNVTMSKDVAIPKGELPNTIRSAIGKSLAGDLPAVKRRTEFGGHVGSRSGFSVGDMYGRYGDQMLSTKNADAILDAMFARGFQELDQGRGGSNYDRAWLAMCLIQTEMQRDEINKKELRVRVKDMIDWVVDAQCPISEDEVEFNKDRLLLLGTAVLFAEALEAPSIANSALTHAFEIIETKEVGERGMVGSGLPALMHPVRQIENPAITSEIFEQIRTLLLNYSGERLIGDQYLDVVHALLLSARNFDDEALAAIPEVKDVALPLEVDFQDMDIYSLMSNVELQSWLSAKIRFLLALNTVETEEERSAALRAILTDQEMAIIATKIKSLDEETQCEIFAKIMPLIYGLFSEGDQTFASSLMPILGSLISEDSLEPFYYYLIKTMQPTNLAENLQAISNANKIIVELGLQAQQSYPESDVAKTCFNFASKNLNKCAKDCFVYADSIVLEHGHATATECDSASYLLSIAADNRNAAKIIDKFKNKTNNGTTLAIGMSSLEELPNSKEYGHLSFAQRIAIAGCSLNPTSDDCNEFSTWLEGWFAEQNVNTEISDLARTSIESFECDQVVAQLEERDYQYKIATLKETIRDRYKESPKLTDKFLKMWNDYPIAMHDHGDYENAEKEYNRMVNLLRDSGVPKSDSWLIWCLSRQAKNQLKLERYADAEKTYREVFALHPEYHRNTMVPSLGFLHRRLAKCLEGQGESRFAEAEQEYLVALDIYESMYNDDSNLQKTVINNLADLYDAWDKPQLAKQYRDRLGVEVTVVPE